MATIGNGRNFSPTVAKDSHVVARLATARAEKASDAPAGEFTPILVPTAKLTTIVIEHRTLIRDCLVTCLRGMKSDEVIGAVATVSELLQVRAGHMLGALVLLCTGERKDADIERDIALLSKADPPVAIILLSDGEKVAHILGALDKGARGYIPTSMSLDVAVEAMHLVRAGGVFVPASSLIASRNSLEDPATTSKGCPSGLFTARQAAVVDSLRQGKANKIIAYELNMRESTVKVHVRNIMKKLHAKNRTEVAYRLNGMELNGVSY